MIISGLNDGKDCNFMGQGAWLQQLSGPAASQFHAATPTPWRIGSSLVGFIQDGGKTVLPSGHSRGLSWVKVLNAGHMSPRDQPFIIDLILNNTGLPELISHGHRAAGASLEQAEAAGDAANIIHSLQELV